MADDEEPGWSKVEFTQTPDDLFQHGPTLHAGILRLPLSSNRGAGVLAQLDTGAGITAIPLRMAEKLGLEPLGYGELREAGRDVRETPYYRVELLLSERIRFPLDIIGLETLSPPHDLLIGRDVLSNGKLEVDFLTGVTRFRFRTS